jgi:AcrR family transcriptional regulator
MARPKSDIDVRIIHAARKRFLQQGVDGASLRDIARAARTSIGMIYYYFPTKDDLFLAVLEEVYARLLPDLERALAPDAAVKTRLSRLFGRLAAMTEDEFVVVRLVLREVMVSSERRQRVIQRLFRGHVPLMLAAMAEGLASGELGPGRPPLVMTMAAFALAVIPQLLRRLAGGELPPGLLPDAPALAEQLVGILQHGICVPPFGPLAPGGRRE